jgi:AcrR family transcriptional regulator
MSHSKFKLDYQHAIIEAPLELYNENPSASLADIAARAGVGRATLHRHFKGREDLLLVLAKQAIKEITAVALEAFSQSSSSLDALKRVMAAIIPLANRQWFLAYENFDKVPDVSSAYERQLSGTAFLISSAKKEGDIQSDLSDIWLARVYDNLIFAAWEMVQDEEATPKQAEELAWKTFCEGCVAKMSSDEREGGDD